MILNRYFFGIGVYVIILLMVGVLVRKFTLADLTLPFPMRDKEILTKENTLKSRMLEISEQDIADHDLNIIVKQ